MREMTPTERITIVFLIPSHLATAFSNSRQGFVIVHDKLFVFILAGFHYVQLTDILTITAGVFVFTSFVYFHSLIAQIDENPPCPGPIRRLPSPCLLFPLFPEDNYQGRGSIRSARAALLCLIFRNLTGVGVGFRRPAMALTLRTRIPWLIVRH